MKQQSQLLSYFKNQKDGVVIYEEIPINENTDESYKNDCDNQKFRIQILNFNKTAKKLLYLDCDPDCEDFS